MNIAEILENLEKEKSAASFSSPLSLSAQVGILRLVTVWDEYYRF